MGAYSKWALIRVWALNGINSVCPVGGGITKRQVGHDNIFLGSSNQGNELDFNNEPLRTRTETLQAPRLRRAASSQEQFNYEK